MFDITNDGEKVTIRMTANQYRIFIQRYKDLLDNCSPRLAPTYYMEATDISRVLMSGLLVKPNRPQDACENDTMRL